MDGFVTATSPAKKTNTAQDDLFAMANSYHYAPDSFQAIYEEAKKRILAYDPKNKFGEYLYNHQERVGVFLSGFLINLGYPSTSAKQIGDAMKLHDFGKTLQDPTIWDQSIPKDQRSDAAKAERPKHTELGLITLDQVIQDLKIILTPDQQKHIDLIKYLMLNHHERLDGKGPRGMTEMGVILQCAAIVDAVDGKLKNRDKTIEQIFDELTGEKHKGEFDPVLVRKYQAYYTNAPQRALALTPAS